MKSRPASNRERWLMEILENIFNLHMKSSILTIV